MPIEELTDFQMRQMYLKLAADREEGGRKYHRRGPGLRNDWYAWTEISEGEYKHSRINNKGCTVCMICCKSSRKL
jgi:hypothetical protein